MTEAYSHDGATTLYGRVNEDGDYSILARITSLDGGGEEVRPGEGKCLLIADVDTVTIKVFDLGTSRDSATGTTISPNPAALPADVFLDTLSRVGWGIDAEGYNFRHDLSPAYSPDSGKWYLVEYRITTVIGAVIWIKARVESRPVLTS